MMNDPGKSDRPIVPNDGPGPSATPANQPEVQGSSKEDYWSFWERVQQAGARCRRSRGLAEDKAAPEQQGDWTQRHLRAGPSPVGRSSAPEALPNELERIRQAARRDKGLKFTSLWHHVYKVDRLREAYLGLKRQAAPGEDRLTWEAYGKDLEANLRDLSERLARGTYRARPVLRVYIPKADGRQRPIGIPVLEDKIVQRATVEVLNAVYEEDFLGFSYGFRPGRSCHMALDALAVAIHSRKVNWILDADIRGFFDSLDHEWLVKFIEHRIADRRVIRHIRKWLNAGVLEEGRRWKQEDGVPQGGSISPLAANIYLHYVLDLWAEQWRRKQARGEMIIVRYADDFVVGFQHESDAERFLDELRERFRRFKLELHAEKTRVIEFGRFAAGNRARRGEGRPQTFNFLGFTHACDTRQDGRFVVRRRTMVSRMRAKLKQVREELRRRMHQSIQEVGQWLGSVVGGYMRYHAVPRNLSAIFTFRGHVTRLWRWMLSRRSQKGSVTWERMRQIADYWLPQPRVCHPYPSDRLGVTIQGKSPVR